MCSCPLGYFGNGLAKSFGGTGCTAVSSPNVTTTTSSTTSTTSTSGTTTGILNSTTTSSTTGGAPPSIGSTSSNVWDQGVYTGGAPGNPYNPGFEPQIDDVILPSGSTPAPTAPPAQQPSVVALAVVVSIVGVLIIVAVALAILYYRTRHDYLYDAIRYTNNPDNVVI